MIVLQSIKVEPVKIEWQSFKPRDFISWYWNDTKYRDSSVEKKFMGAPVEVHPSFVINEELYAWESVEW